MIILDYIEVAYKVNVAGNNNKNIGLEQFVRNAKNRSLDLLILEAIDCAKRKY